jgi:hypothetical protein
MGLSMVLLDCNGQMLDRIDDPRNFLHKLLPPADEESQGVLSKIDWYGDTYFNYLQMRNFLTEWALLMKRAQSAEEQALVTKIKELASRCQKDRDTLRFIGD